MSDIGDRPGPVKDDPADVPSEVGNRDGGADQSGPQGPCNGLPGDSQSGIGSASSESWQLLLEAARGGSRKSQATLFTAVRQQLVRLANQGIGRRYQSKFDGSDVVQETLIDAACGIGKFQGKTRADFVAWLKGILFHRVANARRRYGDTEKRRVDREVPFDRSLTIPADDTSPSVQAMRDESHERLEQALRRLPEMDEQILRLRNQLNLTLDEIATALGCSRNAASQRWARAVHRLQLEFDRDNGSP